MSPTRSRVQLRANIAVNTAARTGENSVAPSHARNALGGCTTTALAAALAVDTVASAVAARTRPVVAASVDAWFRAKVEVIHGVSNVSGFSV